MVTQNSHTGPGQPDAIEYKPRHAECKISSVPVGTAEADTGTPSEAGQSPYNTGGTAREARMSAPPSIARTVPDGGQSSPGSAETRPEINQSVPHNARAPREGIKCASSGAGSPPKPGPLCPRCAAGSPPKPGPLCPRCAAATASSKVLWKTIAVTVGTAVAVGGGAVVLAPLVLSAAGFGAAGVAAGSLATGIQSTMGGVIVKGSWFALCQSWGAVGIPAAVQGLLGASGAAIGGTAGGLTAFFKGKGRKKESSEDSEKKPEEKPREEPDGTAEKRFEKKLREEDAGEPDGEAEKQKQQEIAVHLCPRCGAIYFWDGVQWKNAD